MGIIETKRAEIFHHLSVEKQMLIWGFLTNLSPLTKIAYEKDLKKFFFFMEKSWPSFDLLHVQYEHMLSFKKYLEKNGGKGGQTPAHPKTVNRSMACLKKFFRHIQQRGLIEKNPADLIDTIKTEKTVKSFALSLEQWQALMSLPEINSLSGLLHQAVRHLLFSTGMRKAELRNLTIENLKNNDGIWSLEYKAKGNKLIVKALNESCTNSLMKYLKKCKDHGYDFRPESYLLRPSINRSSENFCEKPLQGTSIDYIVKSACEKVGINPKKVSAHTARATVISILHDRGVDLKTIRDYVGHSSIEMTVEYIKREISIKNSPAKFLEV